MTKTKVSTKVDKPSVKEPSVKADETITVSLEKAKKVLGGSEYRRLVILLGKL